MHTHDSPYITDWFAASLRWLAILGLIVSLALGGLLVLSSALPLAVLALWNIWVTILAALNVRLKYHRQVSLSIDIIVTSLFFWQQGGLSGPAPWAGLLPILSATIYFELWGALVVAGLMALLEVGVAWFQTPDLKIIWAAGMAAACTLLLGIIFGFLGRAVTKRLRQTRLLRIEVEEKKRHIEHERLRTLYELTSTIIGTLNYKRVLDSALDLSVSALNPDQSNTIDERLVSAVLLFKGNQLGVGSARRFTNADMRVTLSGSEGILKKVFDEGEPAITTNVGFDPELGRIIALRSCTSAYCFPLRSGFNVYGTLLFAHSDPNYFTEDRREILDILGHQAVIAIQNARLYQDLVEEKERMIEVQEETRKKLARDLHDGPTQTISAMAMRLNLTHRMIEDNPKAASEELAKIEELAHQTTKEIRHMLFTLRPLVLESQGLVAALQAMADKMRDIYTQNVSVEVNEKLIEQLEMGKQGVMFYIVEEAINNARKYAKASNIWVRLRSIDPGLALLEIQDNGVGFDVAAVTRAYDQRGSLGMINLQERTELINGLLNIDSAPGKGTNVQVYIPLTDEAADRLHHAK